MRTCPDSHLCLPIPQLFPYSLLSFQILQMNCLCSYLKPIPHFQAPLTFSWISHWLFFPFAPISSFFSYILNHSHHHINISSILKTNLPTNFTFPAASLLRFSSPCHSKIPRVLSIPAVTNAFPPLKLFQVRLSLSPLHCNCCGQEHL